MQLTGTGNCFQASRFARSGLDVVQFVGQSRPDMGLASSRSYEVILDSQQSRASSAGSLVGTFSVSFVPRDPCMDMFVEQNWMVEPQYDF